MMKLYAIVSILSLAALSYYVVYTWGDSSARQEILLQEAEAYKEVRKKLDEKARSAPTAPDDALKWLRDRKDRRAK